jgi:hypothetical protein
LKEATCPTQEKGLSEECIVPALNVNVANIRTKRDMVDGTCPEVIELLKTSHVTADAFGALRKMKPIRQIEAAEHMVASGTYSLKFARALLAVTRPEFLLEVPSAKRLEATSKGTRLMFEQETESLVKDLRSVEASYGTDILALTVICGYLDRLFGNPRVERHLKKYRPDILSSITSLLTELKPRKQGSPRANQIKGDFENTGIKNRGGITPLPIENDCAKTKSFWKTFSRQAPNAGPF